MIPLPVFFSSNQLPTYRSPLKKVSVPILSEFDTCSMSFSILPLSIVLISIVIVVSAYKLYIVYHVLPSYHLSNYLHSVLHSNNNEFLCLLKYFFTFTIDLIILPISLISISICVIVYSFAILFTVSPLSIILVTIIVMENT